jgi:hypothetical protein
MLTLSKVLSEETVATDDAPTTPSDHLEEPSDPKTALLSDTLDFEILQDDRMHQNTIFNDFETSEQFMDPALFPSSVDWDNLQFLNADETTPVRSSEDTVAGAPTPLYIDPRLLTGEIDFEGLAETNL